MARASENSMEELHGALCGYFLKLIAGQIPEMVKEDRTLTDPETGEITKTVEWVATGLAVRPGAGDLAVMAKFLKDNAITGAVVEGSELSDLEKALADKHIRRGKLPTAKDAEQVMRELGRDLVQ